MSVAVSLHFDLKFSGLDYGIHRLTNPRVTEHTAERLVADLLARRDCDIGVFLRHFRRQFNTRDLVRSPLALEVLRMRERGKTFHTIESERGHARERLDLQSKGPGKNFVHHWRRDVLSRSLHIHLAAGGSDPCRMASRRNPPKIRISDDPLAAVLPSHILRLTGSDMPRPLSLEDLPRVGQTLAMARRLPSPQDSPGALAQRGQGALEHRTGRVPDSSPVPVPTTGRGGSIWMTIYNAKLAALKLSAAGRPLTEQEREQARVDAHRERDAALDEGGDRLARWAGLYRDDQGVQRLHTARSTTSSSGHGDGDKAYRRPWGLIGTPTLPVQPEEALAHVQSEGVPSHEEVYRCRSHIIGDADIVYPLRGTPVMGESEA